MEKRHQLPDQYVYKGMVLSGKWCPREAVRRVENFSLDGNVLLATYPKTGTTWVQEIVWLVQNEVDVTNAQRELITSRWTFLDIVNPATGQLFLDEIKEPTEGPRLFKTHLNASIYENQLKSDNLKVVLVIRNPKDTLVSLYHFYTMNSTLGSYVGTWNEFFDELVRSKTTNRGDFFDWYVSWFKVRDQTQLLLVKYEDIQKDIRAQIGRLADFLGKKLTAEQVDVVANHCSFDSMKDNPSVNYSFQSNEVLNQEKSKFMREGKVGDWKNYFTEEQSRYIDDLYKEMFEPFGVQLDFEL